MVAMLTALFLPIAVATTLLDCGPVVPPAPADDGVLPAAQGWADRATTDRAITTGQP